MLGGAAAGSVAGEAAAASCAHPGLFDPWEIQLILLHRADAATGLQA